MFHRLHRLTKWLVGAFVLGIFAYLWTQRAALEPLLVWYQVYKNGGFENEAELPVVEGRALHIADGHTVRLKTEEGAYFLVRLAGLDYPSQPLSAYEAVREKKRLEVMRNLVYSNWVSVEVTFSDQHSALGIVHVGKTNLNLHYITNGLATLNRDYIKRMPREHQYDFFSAARSFEQQREETLAAKTQ